MMKWDGKARTLREALRIIDRYSDTVSTAAKKKEREAVAFQIDFGKKSRVIVHRGEADQQEIEESIVR